MLRETISRSPSTQMHRFDLMGKQLFIGGPRDDNAHRSSRSGAEAGRGKPMGLSKPVRGLGSWCL